MTDTSQSTADRAEAHFQDGYNCAQSVLWAVAEAQGAACPNCIPAVGLAMGGGIGHTGRACGALTGAVMGIGLAVSRAVRGPVQEQKDVANRLAGALVAQFADAFGSPDCATILGFRLTEPDAFEQYRRQDAKNRKCIPCVRWAAQEAVRTIAKLREPKA